MTNNLNHNLDRNARYGVNEVGNIAEFTDDFHAFLDSLTEDNVPLSDPRLARVTRIRLIGASREYPMWDLSYAYGQLKDGSNVRLYLEKDRFGRFTYKRELIELAKATGRFIPGIMNISTLAG